jgi:hypothetical protein
MNFTERQVKAWIVATAATLAEDGVVTPEVAQEVEEKFLEEPAVPNEVVAEVITVLQEEVNKVV